MIFEWKRLNLVHNPYMVIQFQVNMIVWNITCCKADYCLYCITIVWTGKYFRLIFMSRQYHYTKKFAMQHFEGDNWQANGELNILNMALDNFDLASHFLQRSIVQSVWVSSTNCCLWRDARGDQLNTDDPKSSYRDHVSVSIASFFEHSPKSPYLAEHVPSIWMKVLSEHKLKMQRIQCDIRSQRPL